LKYDITVLLVFGFISTQPIAEGAKVIIRFVI